MAFVDSLVAQLLRCQVDLWEIQARLQAETDREALHDLRIQLRRLRSLLRPLRRHAGIAPLYAAAAALARPRSVDYAFAVTRTQARQRRARSRVAICLRNIA